MSVISSIFDIYKYESKYERASDLTKKLLKLVRQKSLIRIHDSDLKASVIVCDTDDKIKLFLATSMMFYMLHRIRKIQSVIGLDFEFNTLKGMDRHQIALNQIALFFDDSHIQIFIVDPLELDDWETRVYHNTVLLSPIRRIVHGADSLDIPYLFEEAFRGNTEKIFRFTRWLTDTRYMCEYYKICIQYTDRKCSIYDGLLFFGTIDNRKYDFLNKTNENISPTNGLTWDIHRLTRNHVLYAAYDVLYLRRFLRDIQDRFDEDMPEKKQSIIIIPSLTRLVYYSKWDITQMVYDAKKQTDQMNNLLVSRKTNKTYMIRNKAGMDSLNDSYESFIDSAYVYSLGVRLRDLLDINYFKSTLQPLLKQIVYKKYITTYKITGKKRIAYRSNDNDMVKELEKLRLPRVALLFQEIDRISR